MKLGFGLSVNGGRFNSLHPLFAASILELTNKFGVGSYPSAIRNSTGTAIDYAGTLQTMAINQHRVTGARWTGSAWVDDDGLGNLVHPKKVIDGAPWYLTKPDWTAGVAYAAGAEVNNGGKWYSTVAGGTDTATFGDTVTWIEQGIYSGIGLLDEGSANQLSVVDISAFPNSGGTVTKVLNATAIDPFGTNRMVDVTTPANFDYVGDMNHSVTGGANQICSVFGLRNSGIINVRLTNAVSTERNVYKIDTNTQTISYVSSAAATNVASGVIPFNGTLDIYWWKGSLNTTAANAGVMFLQNNDATATGATLFGANMYAGEVLQSYIDGQIVQANEMGNIKWDSRFFQQTKGTMALTWMPRFASGDLAAANRAIAVTQDVNYYGLMTQQLSSVANLRVGDGTNNSLGTMSAWSRNDAIDLIVEWDDSIPQMSLHYRNASNGDAWTHIPPVAYDGAFPNTGFLQLLKSGGGNNSMFRNIPRVYGTTFTTAELEAKFQ